ncbi:MAG: alkaline phosphatase PhoX [Solirubrobacteraceae bacterium]
MLQPSRRRCAAAGAAVALTFAATAAAQPGGAPDRGPNTSVGPYVIPAAEGVKTTSLLTVGDEPASNGYKMVGIPDGMGAFRRKGDRFNIVLNHELRTNQGVVRRHGQKGALVSKLRIDARTLEVTAGSDLIDPGVQYWDYVSQMLSATASLGGPNPRSAGDAFVAQSNEFARFCSGALTDAGQLFNEDSGRGYDGQIYFANEENGDEGRVFGVTEDGTAQQLPRLGLFSWENALAAYNTSDTTLVMGQEDAATGQLWAYVGRKSKRGSAFRRAGLTNGAGNVINVVDGLSKANPAHVSTDAEYRAAYGKGKAIEVELSEVDWDQSGARQNAEAAADGLTLNRIEDGAWDPRWRHRNDFYFLTTEGQTGAPSPTGLTGRDGGGLWRLSFEDREHPEDGATLTLLLDGSEAPFLNKPDNMTIDKRGNLLIQEDPGKNVSVARIVAYDIATGRRGVVATFDPDLFAPATPGGEDAKITVDEESSGIIPTDQQLGKGTFLFDAQIHPAKSDGSYNDGTEPTGEEAEKGQLLVLRVKDFEKVYE